LSEESGKQFEWGVRAKSLANSMANSLRMLRMVRDPDGWAKSMANSMANCLPMYFGVSENSLVCLFIIKLFEVFFWSDTANTPAY